MGGSVGMSRFEPPARIPRGTSRRADSVDTVTH